MGKQKARDKRLLVAKKMPVLRRKQLGKEYSLQNDNVLAWISKQTELLAYVSDKLAHEGYIEYDSKNGTWKGVDYDGD